MKKLIYIPVAILFFTALIILLLKPANPQSEKVTIQTNLRPVRVVEMNRTIYKGKTRTLWVQDKNAKEKNISFYTDAVTLEAIVAKLRSTSETGKKNKGERKFTWLVEKNETSTFLKLIYPALDNFSEPARGC